MSVIGKPNPIHVLGQDRAQKKYECATAYGPDMEFLWPRIEAAVEEAVKEWNSLHESESKARNAKGK